MKSSNIPVILAIIICLTLLPAAGFTAYNAPSARIYKTDTGLGSIFNIATTKEPIYLILVEKNLQRLRVLEYDDELRVVAEYPSATGENAGIKEISGDAKTPEGIYFITKVFKDDEITIFGDKAFHLDYPNFFDRKAGRNGDGIYIHGTNKELMPNSTNGCVTLGNADLDNLEKYLNQVVTPVVIVSELDQVNTSKVELLKENDFRLAQTLLLDEHIKLENVEYNYLYIISYGNQTVAVSDFIYRPFNSSIMRGASRTYLEYTPARAWEAGKRIWRASPLQIYPESPVKVAAHPLSSGEIQLAAQSPQETEAMFAALSAQNVSRPSPTASDSLPPAQIELKPQPVVPTQPKVEKIALQPVVPTQPKVEKIVPQPVVQTPPEAEKIDLQADKTPKIKPVPAATEPETPAPRKTVLNTSEQVASVMAATTGVRKDKQQIIAFIEDWRQAWVSKQIDPYIAFYDASFKSGGKNLAQWKAHKKNLNETYAFISVNLSDITVDWTDRGATVSFLQEYRSDRYSAKGKKTLYLVHDSNGWKIKREVYSRI